MNFETNLTVLLCTSWRLRASLSVKLLSDLDCSNNPITLTQSLRRLSMIMLPFFIDFLLPKQCVLFSISDLPRHTIFFDVVDFAYNQRMTPRLKEEIPLLMSRPVTQEVQVRHIQAISKMRLDICDVKMEHVSCSETQIIMNG